MDIEVAMKNSTITYWQKEHGKDWETITTHMHMGRGIGKSTYTQTYINGILQEYMQVLNKKYWPHQFKMDYSKDIDKMERWCYANLKSANWRNYGTYFAFKKQEDASYFLLMWS